jgi:cytochrome c oxidase cbb3-type subunit 3
MSEEQNVKKMDHDFDGIEELDNPLPGWWLGIFYVTIAIAIIYPIYFHVMHPEKLTWRAYDANEQALAEAQAAAPKEEWNEDKLWAAYEEGSWKDGAAEAFKTHCSACHREDGSGQIGPNFHDDYYIHGGTLTTFVDTITNGVLAKGMTPFGNVLSPANIRQLAYYVRSLRGTPTSLPDPKAPEGRQVDERGNFIDGEAAAEGAPAAPEVATAMVEEVVYAADVHQLAMDDDALWQEYQGAWDRTKAKELYGLHCAVCHLPDGGGIVGPNMTDDFYLNGGRLKDFIAMANEGKLTKGMTPFKAVLKPDEIKLVAFHMRSLRGTTPATPKAVQGKEVDERGVYLP